MHSPLPVRYRLSDGSPVISVTQTLNLAGQIDSTWFTPEACLRGSLVHKITEDIDARRPHEIPEGVKGYLDGYQLFLAIVKPKYIGVEVKVTNPILKLGGQIDRVCAELFGATAIIDLKTGPPAKWHALQLAAYRAMHPVATRFALYLSKDGKYKLREYNDITDHRRFMFHLAKVRGTITPDGDYWRAAA